MKNYKILDRIEILKNKGVDLNNAEEFIDLQRAASKVIDKLSDGRYISVMYGRYILFYTWETIANELSVTISYAHRLHKQALKQFYKAIRDNKSYRNFRR